jgi:hypothetical protein
VREFPARKDPIENNARPTMKNLCRPLLSDYRPKIGMKEASMRREISGTQMTTSIGAFRFIEITGRMKMRIPVSRGGTKFPRLIAKRESHL